MLQLLENPTSSKCFCNRSTVLNRWTETPLTFLSTSRTAKKVIFFSRLSSWPFIPSPMQCQCNYFLLLKVIDQNFVCTMFSSTIECPLWLRWFFCNLGIPILEFFSILFKRGWGTSRSKTQVWMVQLNSNFQILPPLCRRARTWYLSFFLHGQNFWRIKLHQKTPIFRVKFVKKTPLFRVKSVENANFSR